MLVLLVVFPIVGLSSAQLVFGITADLYKCDKGGLVGLNNWLIITASVALGYIALFCPLAVAGIYQENKSILGAAFVTSLVYVVWSIGWSIVGGYTFFKYAFDSCKIVEYDVWVMMLISLAYMWFSLAAVAVLVSLLEKENVVE